MPKLTQSQIERRLEALGELRDAHRESELARQRLGWSIASARKEGVHWQAIASELGMDWRSARLIARQAGRRI